MENLIEAIEAFQRAKEARDNEPDLEIGGIIDSDYWRVSKSLRLAFREAVKEAMNF